MLVELAATGERHELVGRGPRVLRIREEQQVGAGPRAATGQSRGGWATIESESVIATPRKPADRSNR